jgi:hypothetical protein
MTNLDTALTNLAERMAALEERLKAIQVGQVEKDWYSTEDVAALMDRAPWTVREWCRHGRIKAKKRAGTDRWVVSKEELERLMNHGLLPAKG